MLEIIKTLFSDVYIIKSNSHMDERGSYTRLFCEKELASILNNKHFVNANYQITKKRGTIRGLHYQLEPYAEMKLIKCIKGEIFDTIVDLRPESPTYLNNYSIKLDDKSDILLFVPTGFAHGFQTLKDMTETIYFTTEFYQPKYERGLNPLDPDLKIQWPISNPILSEKDKNRVFIKDKVV